MAVVALAGPPFRAHRPYIGAGGSWSAPKRRLVRPCAPALTAMHVARPRGAGGFDAAQRCWARSSWLLRGGKPQGGLMLGPAVGGASAAAAPLPLPVLCRREAPSPSRRRLCRRDRGAMSGLSRRAHSPPQMQDCLVGGTQARGSVPRRRGKRGLKGTRMPPGPCREHQDRRDGGREGLSPGWAQV